MLTIVESKSEFTIFLFKICNAQFRMWKEIWVSLKSAVMLSKCKDPVLDTAL